MKKTKKVLEILKYNIGPLIGFQFLFKILTIMIFTPLFVKEFSIIMKITNYQYLSLENITSFLLNPLTMIMLIILILLMTVYTMLDITTIIVILDSSYQKKKIKIIDAIKISINKCNKIFHIKNISLAFFILFLIPFLNFGLASSFITIIKISEFIYDFIEQNTILFILMKLLTITLFIILLKWIYSLHYFVLEDVSFKEARKKSKNLGKKHHLTDIISLIIVQLGIVLLYFLFVLFGILIILLLNNIFKDIVILQSITTTIIWIFIALSFLIVTFLVTPISYASISVLYYLKKEEKSEKIKHIKIPEKEITNRLDKILKKGFITLFIISLIIGSIFTYGLYKGKYNLNIEYIRTIEVTAHRGSSINYPENTMSAFIAAKKQGADFIELDVQQTKDGKIIVVHDHNLKRTTGINKNTWETTYEEISTLDAGSFLDKKFKNEKIPLLEDVIKWAKKNQMKLNIELKPTGHENNFEKKVIDIITELNFEKNCVITSQTYHVLEKVKKINKEIKTVYVMSLAYGNILSLKDADHFSIEATSATPSLVNRIHKEGKQLYVWTVNTEDGIRKMIDLKVDNIITDDISLTKDIIYSSKTSNLINEYIKWIDKLLY